MFGIVTLCALALIGATIQQRDLRKVTCQDRVSLVWMALRAVNTLWVLSGNFIDIALFSARSITQVDRSQSSYALAMAVC